MLKVFAHIILGGLLALNGARAQDSGKPVRRTLLVYQIDTAQIRKVWLQFLQQNARRALMEEKIAHKGVVIEKDQVRVNLRIPGEMNVALPRLKKLATPLPGLLSDGLIEQSPGSDLAVADAGNGVIIIEPTAAGLANRIAGALSRAVEIVRMRIDPHGTGGATVEPQERDRILIQAPKLATAEVIARVSVTAKLTFQLVDTSISVKQAQAEGVPPGDLLLPDMDQPGRFVLVYKEAILSGDDLVDAYGSDHGLSGRDRAAVYFEFNAKGAVTFARFTRENIGKPFAIVLDDKVLSAPVIGSEVPGGHGMITGNFSLEEANRLALLLRSGALPAPLSIMEERTGE